MSDNYTKDRRKYDSLSLDEKVDEALSLLSDIIQAFPEGPHKHRQDHEDWLEAKKEEIKFWRDLKYDIANKGIIGFLILLIGLLIVGFQQKLHSWFS